MREHPADQRPDDAAHHQARLHDSHAKTQFFRRRSGSHQRHCSRHEAAGQPLQHPHRQKFPRIADECAEKVNQRQTESGPHDHLLFAGPVGPPPPVRRQDRRHQKTRGKNHAGPHFHLLACHAQVKQKNRQERYQHRIARTAQNNGDNQDPKILLPHRHDSSPPLRLRKTSRFSFYRFSGKKAKRNGPQHQSQMALPGRLQRI